MNTTPTHFNANDPQLVSKIVALFPPPSPPSKASTVTVINPQGGGPLTPEMQQAAGNGGVGSQIYNQNLNQQIRYEMVTPNQQIHDQFAGQVYAWSASRGTTFAIDFPRRPKYRTLVVALYESWWTQLLANVQANWDKPDTVADVNPPHFYMQDAELPPLPIVDDTPVDQGPPVSSPVGAYRGFGIWMATMLAENFPTGYPYPCPDSNSPTGWLKYLPTPFARYWTIGPAPIAAPALTLMDALKNALGAPTVA